MDITKVGPGEKAPEEIHVIIEVPMQSAPVKYEYDKDSGAIFVDRFVHTCMFYPCNYGFVPNTLSGDGDPVDVLVVSKLPVISGAVLKSRPIGVLMMEDESGIDEKILAVPVSKLEKYFDSVKSYKDLPEILLQQISHFFEHYKDLEKGKWVKVKEWKDAEFAKEIIATGIKNFK